MKFLAQVQADLKQAVLAHQNLLLLSCRSFGAARQS